MIDPGTQAATTIPVGKMPSGLAVDAGVHRLRGQPLDNTMIAIDTRTGAQTVISAEGGTTPLSPATPPAGTASVIERR